MRRTTMLNAITTLTTLRTFPRRPACVASVASIVGLAALPALAQTPPGADPVAQAPAPAASAADSLNLDQIVVTGSSTRTSKMRQSLSVSTLDSEQLAHTGATNAAELLRSVPGVRSESSGGEGNANITVRGVPLSAGGSRYVQLQEDGLPVLLFGDVAFGTPDEWLRADANVDRLEVVRGGTASTLASNSPGGIINFVSKTGTEQGGAAAFTLGLDRREYRFDVDYGGKLGPSTRFHIGGFQRTGDGGRPVGFNAATGGQIKGNLTQEFDAGFVRVNFKFLDDRTPSFQAVPVSVANGRIDTLPGIDPRKAYFIGDNTARDITLNKDNGLTSSDPRNGLRVRSTAVGLESQFDLGAGFSIDERFRAASNGGRFIALFPSGNGAVGTQPYFSGVLFNTRLDGMDNVFNDVKVAKSVQFGSGKLTTTAGLFYGQQDVNQTWFWNTYNFTLQNNNAQQVDAKGAPTTTPILNGYQTFGGCCARTWAVQYSETSPYLALTLDAGPLNIDGSVRHDHQLAKGATFADSPLNGSATAAQIPGFDPSTRQSVDYAVQHNSYSLGANYALTSDLAAFARVSDGVSFSADRLLYGTALDGSLPIQFNEVRQVEGGAKWRIQGLSLFATAFHARTSEGAQFEVTSQSFLANKYDASGVELEAAYVLDALRINGGATYTNATIASSADAAAVGKQPRRQARYVYQLAPSYAIGEMAEVGASFIGTTKSYADDANTVTMPGYVITNAYLNYQVTGKVQLGLSVNNLFNRLAYTESQGSDATGDAVARALNGRTTRLTVAYKF